MKISRLETFLANAGLRNYLFIRLTTDDGLTGVGEASLEWQERAVECLLHDWCEEQIIGVDPFDIERVINNMIRDQYQGGPTILSAISGLEIALWDLIGKACGQPVYKLLGGRVRERLPAYANGWYGGAYSPSDYAKKARGVLDLGYSAMKLDPFGTAWKRMTEDEMVKAETIVRDVRTAIGDKADLMIEVHGRLSLECAIEMGGRLAPYRPSWYEEPVSPWSLELQLEAKRQLPFPVAAGERLYLLEEFSRLISMRACEVVQPDLTHCGGLSIGKKIAALAQVQDLTLAPHCSVGPIALCAAVHFGWSTPNVRIQENFGDFDVPWRSEFVCGWNPCKNGKYQLPEKPGLGVELNETAIAAHPPQKNPFPSLWNHRWLTEFTKASASIRPPTK